MTCRVFLLTDRCLTTSFKRVAIVSVCVCVTGEGVGMWNVWFLFSSLQGKISLPFRSCYGASKHACEAFYLSLRAELEAVHSHIAVCVLSPGYVQTEISLNSTTGSGEVSASSLPHYVR